MKKPIHKSAEGFTLVEILIAIVAGLIVLGAIYVAVNSGQRSSISIEQRVTAQQDARGALQLMAAEIGMASYKLPIYNNGIWRNVADCNTGGVPNNAGIQQATPNAITIEMDITDDGDLSDDNEIVTYTYRADEQRITRQSSCGHQMPFLGDQAGGNPRIVRVRNDLDGNGTFDAAAGEIPVFQYFDLNGNVTTSMQNIRRIDITLVVETDQIDPNTGQRKRMIYSTSVIPRNHAIAFSP